jgi:hypothetical protein
VVAAGGALVLAASGCGTPPADVFLVHRSGAIPGAALVMLVRDDGYVSCNHRPLAQITSAQLVEARAVERDLEEPSAKGVSLRARPGSVLSYIVRSESGTVRFSDNSRPQPQAFFRLAALVRELAKGPCRLPR